MPQWLPFWVSRIVCSRPSNPPGSPVVFSIKQNDVTPLLYCHYSNFITTTGNSAPIEYLSTFDLIVLWLVSFRFSLLYRFPCFTQKPNTCSCHLNAVPQIASFTGLLYPLPYPVVKDRFCRSLTLSTLHQWFTFVHLHVSYLVTKITFSLIAHYHDLNHSSIRVIWQACLFNSCRRTFLHLLCALHGTPPPYVPFGIRRFFSFHRLSDNSQAWMCIPAWLLFYLWLLNLTLVPFSNNLSYYMQVLLLSNALILILWAFGISFWFSSIVSNRPPVFFVLPIHQLLEVFLSYPQV